MKEKQKAKELVERFEKFNKECDCLEYMCVCFHLGLEERKAFALICVDEIIRLLPPVEWELTEDEINELGITEEYKEYWQEVKQEIEKL